MNSHSPGPRGVPAEAGFQLSPLQAAASRSPFHSPIESVSSTPSQFRSAYGFLEKRLLGLPDSALSSLQVIYPTHCGAAILDTMERDQSQSSIRLFMSLCSLLSTSGIMINTTDMQMHLQRST